MSAASFTVLRGQLDLLSSRADEVLLFPFLSQKLQLVERCSWSCCLRVVACTTALTMCCKYCDSTWPYFDICCTFMISCVMPAVGVLDFVCNNCKLAIALLVLFLNVFHCCVLHFRSHTYMRTTCIFTEESAFPCCFDRNFTQPSQAVTCRGSWK